MKSCPVCERDVEPLEENDAFPFCSSRCKQVDLGRWFKEDHTISITPFSTERNLEADEPADEE